jgi:hypothetical protein
VKNGLAIEKPPVTSSNRYESIQDALIFIKLGTHVAYGQ